jgi:hypothetical protein
MERNQDCFFFQAFSSDMFTMLDRHTRRRSLLNLKVVSFRQDVVRNDLHFDLRRLFHVYVDRANGSKSRRMPTDRKLLKFNSIGGMISVFVY